MGLFGVLVGVLLAVAGFWSGQYWLVYIGLGTVGAELESLRRINRSFQANTASPSHPVDMGGVGKTLVGNRVLDYRTPD